jgi:hypothetical protein
VPTELLVPSESVLIKWMQVLQSDVVTYKQSGEKWCPVRTEVYAVAAVGTYKLPEDGIDNVETCRRK